MRTLLCVSLFFSLPAMAQQVRLADRKALMFNLGGLFSSAPSALDGVGVGGRVFLDESLAIRAALGISRSTVETEFNSDFPGNDQDREDKASAYALEGGVEVVLLRAKAAYLYTGGLLQLGIFSEDPEGDDNNSEGYSVTLAGLLGANYFLMEGLAVGAEYRLGLSYSTQHSEDENSETDSSTTFIGTGTVGFHLAFWF